MHRTSRIVKALGFEAGVGAQSIGVKTMLRLSVSIVSLGVLLAAGACHPVRTTSPIRWGSETRFVLLAQSPQDSLSAVVPGGAAPVKAAGYYLSLEGVSVVLPKTPGVRKGNHIVIGARLRGALPGGRSVATIADPQPASQDSRVEFRSFPAFGAFPVGRQPLSLVFQTLPVSGNDLLYLRGRLAGAAGLLRRLDPREPRVRQTGRALHASVFTASRDPRKWAFTVRLPRQPVATTYVAIALPPRQAHAQGDAHRLARALRLGSTGLTWARSGEAYTETPHVIFRLTRHARDPRGQDPGVRTAVRAFESHRRASRWKEAQKALDDIDRAIDEAAILKRERLLELGLNEARRAGLRAALASQQRDQDAAERYRERQGLLLTRILRQFRGFLRRPELAAVRAGLHRR